MVFIVQYCLVESLPVLYGHLGHRLIGKKKGYARLQQLAGVVFLQHIICATGKNAGITYTRPVGQRISSIWPQ
jgi:hypothetical protein